MRRSGQPCDSASSSRRSMACWSASTAMNGTVAAQVGKAASRLRHDARRGGAIPRLVEQVDAHVEPPAGNASVRIGVHESVGIVPCFHEGKEQLAFAGGGFHEPQGASHCAGKIFRLRNANGTVVAIRAAAFYCPECFRKRGQMNAADNGLPSVLERDENAVRGYAAQIGPRSVEGIDNPGPAADAGLASRFLAQKSVRRKLPAEHVADHGFAFFIHLGDGRRILLGVDRVNVLPGIELDIARRFRRGERCFKLGIVCHLLLSLRHGSRCNCAL